MTDADHMAKIVRRAADRLEETVEAYLRSTGRPIGPELGMAIAVVKLGFEMFAEELEQAAHQQRWGY